MTHVGSTPLEQALDKTTEIAHQLEVAVDELVIAHAVLETLLPELAHAEDVRKAVDASASATERVHESAQHLTEVKAVLSEEIANQSSDLTDAGTSPHEG